MWGLVGMLLIAFCTTNDHPDWLPVKVGPTLVALGCLLVGRELGIILKEMDDETK